MSEIYYTGPLPIPWNIELHQGADFAMSFYYKDDNDTAVDLTGYTAQMQVREESGGDLLLDLTTGSGITITAASGKIDIVLMADQTTALEVQNAKYDLLIKSSEDTVTYLLKGDFIVEPRITRMTI